MRKVSATVRSDGVRDRFDSTIKYKDPPGLGIETDGMLLTPELLQTVNERGECEMLDLRPFLIVCFPTCIVSQQRGRQFAKRYG